MTQPRDPDPWDTGRDDDTERTQVLPTWHPQGPDASAPTAPPPTPRNPATPTGRTAPPTPAYADAPAPAPAGDVALPDPRGTEAWDLQASRLQNRVSTDLGLLLWRLCSLPLVLHGIHHVLAFDAFVASFGDRTPAGVSPTVVAAAVATGQLALPLLLGVGLATRIAGFTQALLVAAWYAWAVIGVAPVVDPVTGALSGEAMLAYAAFGLPLALTGGGRFSLDHTLATPRRERVIERRVERRRRA